MPNHIENRLEIIGTRKQVKEVFEAFNTCIPRHEHLAHNGDVICNKTGEKYAYGWYNKHTNVFTRRNEPDLIGIPEGWEIEYEPDYNHFPDFNKVIPQPDNIFNGDLGEADRVRCAKEGIPTWLDWNCANWGTKWNSYSCAKKKSNIFTWQTAWSGVPRIVVTISKKFPTIEFLYEYADEDTGCNTGIYKLLNGIVEEIHYPNNSIEAYELAFKLDPTHKKYYKLVDGKYVSKED
jgi:hypothetical protein